MTHLRQVFVSTVPLAAMSLSVHVFAMYEGLMNYTHTRVRAWQSQDTDVPRCTCAAPMQAAPWPASFLPGG